MTATHEEETKYSASPAVGNSNSNSNSNSNAAIATSNSNAAIATSSSSFFSAQKIWSVLHIALAVFAIFMSFKCNGFKFLHFLAALCCPYFYLPYILAMKGSCGLYSKW